SAGTFDAATNIWTIEQLDADSIATLTLELFPLADDYVPYAQVLSANELDADSTPGNGRCCFEQEDDEASLLGMATPTCSFVENVEIPADICTRCLTEIAVYEWNDATYYAEVAGFVEGCADGLTRVVDCEGTVLCLDGGFAGFRQCERLNFFETATKTEILASCNPKGNVDLELSISTDQPTIGQWQAGTFRITLTNQGTDAATGVAVAFPLDSETVVQVGGSAIAASTGEFDINTGVWENIEVPAGQRAILEMQLFSKVPTLTLYAQVVAANENDVDSTPDNGVCCVANEDDEAVFMSEPTGENLVVGNKKAVSFALAPNPVQDVVMVQTLLENTNYQLLDNTGKVIQRGIISGDTRLDMRLLESGVYIFQLEGASAAVQLVKQ
ncbi:MAG: T9SS type A sorting domain-containing protein, partial [Bacteroidota bacterium]